MKSELLALLYSAINSPFGIVVETDATELLRQKLYALRKEYAPEFEHLSFVVSPINGADLWILNKEQTSAEE
jgi:hypothetical protein